VLLVEDNPINREVALELLKGVGMSVDSAENGRQSVALATAGAYDLVLMDVQMPIMDGLQATCAIRVLPGWDSTPIIAMTANTFEDDRQACLAAGMTDFVSKPVEPDRLFATMLRWLAPCHTGQKHSGAGLGASPSEARVVAPVPETTAASVFEGLDAADGCRRVGGNPEFYVKLLTLFRDKTAADFMTNFNEAFKYGDWVTAQRLAHTLHGTAGTLGAATLSSAAADLESSLRGGRLDRVAGQASLVALALDRVLACIAMMAEFKAQSPGDSRPE
jgi:CheY-like chemotaxis protein